VLLLLLLWAEVKTARARLEAWLSYIAALARCSPDPPPDDSLIDTNSCPMLFITVAARHRAVSVAVPEVAPPGSNRLNVCRYSGIAYLYIEILQSICCHSRCSR